MAIEDEFGIKSYFHYSQNTNIKFVFKFVQVLKYLMKMPKNCINLKILCNMFVTVKIFTIKPFSPITLNVLNVVYPNIITTRWNSNTDLLFF